MWKIVYYRTSAGRSPVEDYIKQLDKADMARLLNDLRLLSRLGLELKSPTVKPMGGKLWELRTPANKGQHRVLYFAASGRQFILLHAFLKKTQKTAAADLSIAKRRMDDFLGGK